MIGSDFRAIKMANLQRREVLVLVGDALGDELHQQHTPAVHIRPAVVQLMPNHFWRHIEVGASFTSQDSHALGGEPAR